MNTNFRLLSAFAVLAVGLVGLFLLVMLPTSTPDPATTPPSETIARAPQSPEPARDISHRSEPRSSSTPDAPIPLAAATRGDGVVLGRVLRIDGTPAQGASVRLLQGRVSPHFPAPDPPSNLRTFADSDGRFEIVDLAEGAYLAWFYTADAAHRIAFTLTPDRRVQELDIRLRPSADVEGVVTTVDGQAVADASVTFAVSRTSHPPFYDEGFRVQTDASGRFRARATPEATYRIVARATTGDAGETVAEIPSISEIQITVGPTPKLVARATLADGSPPGRELDWTLIGEYGHGANDARSDETGTVHFANLLPGRYELYLRDAELAPAEDAPMSFTVHDEQATTDLEIPLVVAAALGGRVADAVSHAGIANAVVQAKSSTSASAAPRWTKTARDGSFRFEGLGARQFVIKVVSAPGYAALGKSRSVRLEPEQAFDAVDFSLHSPGRLSGLVVDAAGQPVRAARIHAWPTRNQSTWSDRNGRFIVGVTAAKSGVRLAARKAGDVAVSDDILSIPPSGELAGIQLRLEPGASVAGKAFGPTGALLATGRIATDSDRDLRALLRGGIPVRNGLFDTGAIPPGHYSFAVGARTSKDDGPHQITLDLAPGERRTDIVLSLEARAGGRDPATLIRSIGNKAATITGSVLGPNDEPVAGARVRAEGRQRAGTATTDANGAFKLTVVPNEIYTLIASASHLSDARQPGVRSDATDIVLQLKEGAAIAGHVVSTGVGPPITEFEIAILREEPTNENWVRSADWIAMSNPNGDIFYSGVPAQQPLVLAARAPGYRPTTVSIAPIPHGETSRPITVYLAAAASVAGTITDALGAPVAGATIQHRAENGRTQPNATSDTDGLFLIEGLEPGEYVIIIEHADFQRQEVAFDLVAGIATEVDIQLDMGGIVEGVVMRGQDPIPAATVIVRLATDRARAVNTQTNAEGYYQFRGLVPGEAEVILTMPRSQNSRRGTFNQYAIIEDGQITTVDFLLPGESGVLEGQIILDGIAPVQGQVTVDVETDLGREQIVGQTDAQGFYRIEEITPGRATITAYAASSQGRFRRKTAEADIRPNVALRQDFVFPATGTLFGTLNGLREGERGALILLPGDSVITNPTPADMLELRRAAVAQTSTARDGTFRFDAIEPGPYTVVASAVDSESASGSDGGLFIAATRFVFATFEVPEGGEFTIDVDL